MVNRDKPRQVSSGTKANIPAIHRWVIYWQQQERVPPGTTERKAMHSLVQGQVEHHLRMTFKKEFEVFLKQRGMENVGSISNNFFRPRGAWMGCSIPAMNRWAIVGRPCGTFAAWSPPWSWHRRCCRRAGPSGGGRCVLCGRRVMAMRIGLLTPMRYLGSGKGFAHPCSSVSIRG